MSWCVTMFASRVSESAIGAAVIVVTLYHALYCIYIRNWAVERAARVSSKAFYKGSNRIEFEKREADYALTIDKLVAMAMRSSRPKPEDILEHLHTLRGSIFFDEKYRAEYDILWIACLENSYNDDDDISTEELVKKCKMLNLQLPVGFQMEANVSIQTLLQKLCAKLRN